MATQTNQVVTGFDAQLMINNVVVGRSQEFKVNVKNSLETIYEQGTRKPAEIKEKKYEVTGSLRRLYINQDRVKSVLGNGNTFSESLPYVNIQAYFKNPSDGTIKTITIENAKFGDWDITAALEANVEENVTFSAMNVIIG